jgi:hypothetical protein
LLVEEAVSGVFGKTSVSEQVHTVLGLLSPVRAMVSLTYNNFLTVDLAHKRRALDCNTRITIVRAETMATEVEMETLLCHLDEASRAKVTNIPDGIKKRAFILSKVYTKYYSNLWLLSKNDEDPPASRKGNLKDARAFYCIECEREFPFSNRQSNPSTEPIKRHLRDKHPQLLEIDVQEEDLEDDGQEEQVTPAPEQSTPKAKKQKKMSPKQIMSYLQAHNDSYERIEKCGSILVAPSRIEAARYIDEQKQSLESTIKSRLSHCDGFHVTINRIEASCPSSSSTKKVFTMVGVRYCTPEFRLVTNVLEVEIGEVVTCGRLLEILSKWGLDSDKLESIVKDNEVIFDFKEITPQGPATTALTCDALHLSNRTLTCILGSLNAIVMPHLFTNFGDLIYAISPSYVPGTIPLMYDELLKWESASSIDPLQAFTFGTLLKVLKPFRQIFNYLRNKNASIGATLLACRSLYYQTQTMALEDAPCTNDPAQKRRAQATEVNQKMKRFFITLQTEVARHPLVASNHHFQYTIPLVPELSGMNGLADQEKELVKTHLTKLIEDAQGGSEQERARDSEVYGDLLSIQNQESANRYEYFDYYVMQSKRHTALNRCGNPGEWWINHGSDFPELRSLARTWLASSAICEVKAGVVVPLLSTDDEGNYDADATKLSLWIGANDEKCFACMYH